MITNGVHILRWCDDTKRLLSLYPGVWYPNVYFLDNDEGDYIEVIEVAKVGGLLPEDVAYCKLMGIYIGVEGVW